MCCQQNLNFIKIDEFNYLIFILTIVAQTHP